MFVTRMVERPAASSVRANTGTLAAQSGQAGVSGFSLQHAVHLLGFEFLSHLGAVGLLPGGGIRGETLVAHEGVGMFRQAAHAFARFSAVPVARFSAVGSQLLETMDGQQDVEVFQHVPRIDVQVAGPHLCLSDVAGKGAVGGIAPGGLLLLPLQVKRRLDALVIQPARRCQSELAVCHGTRQWRPGDGELWLA